MIEGKKTKFWLDGLDAEFEGYTFEDYWNGFACPNFEKDQVIRMMKVFNQKPEPEDFQYFEAWFEGDNFYVKDRTVDEVEVFEPEEIDTVDGLKTTYSVGSHAWCWLEKDIHF